MTDRDHSNQAKVNEKKRLSVAQAMILAALITATGLIVNTIVDDASKEKLAKDIANHQQNPKPLDDKGPPEEVKYDQGKTATKDISGLPKRSATAGQSFPKGTTNPGCALFGDLQLCWGNVAFTPRNDPKVPVCDFAMTFERPFAAPPSVTTSMQGQTSGFAYAVYSQQVTSAEITGSGLEVLRRASPETVVVSYVAIGPPVPSAPSSKSP